MATVADHLAVLRRLLHDPNDTIWSQTDKIAYIASAIQRRDVDTGANRVLYTKVLTASDDTYSFSNLGNANIFDIIGAVLVYGSSRLVLEQMSLTQLNAAVRRWTSYTSYPVAFARVGQTVILGPSPASTYTTEWDTCVFASTVTATSDSDPLPYPFTEPVPYYAAYLAKLNEREADEAQQFFETYAQQVSIAVGQRAGMLPSPYSSGLR